jgi:hypothetical protein
MSKQMHVGYYGTGFDSPAYRLTELYGDCLEQINSNDKLALISVLAMWLAEDDADYELINAMNDCNMTASPNFAEYVRVLKRISPDDALSLIAALTAQLKEKVFAQ